MVRNYSGYGVKCITMTVQYEDTLQAGDLVKLANNGDVITKANENDTFIGVATNVTGSKATVQTQGYIELDYTAGETIPYGPVKLVAGAKGVAIDKTANSVNYVRTVLSIDLADKKIGVIL